MAIDGDTEKRIIQHCWTFGHFLNDGEHFEETRNVVFNDLDRLSVGDKVVEYAIKSLQESDANLEDLCDLHHGRELECDGHPGPATAALIDLPRCGCPDHGPEAAGSGGWMKCDDGSDAHHSVRIKFDGRKAPPKWQSYLRDVLDNAKDISADIGLDVKYLIHDYKGQFESSVLFKRIPGSVIGLYFLPSGSGCTRIGTGALDIDYQPDVVMASLLWIHEGLGHGIGLRHTNGGIMNPSLRRTEMSWRNDPSWRAVQRLYGGIPLNPDPEPEPDPPKEDPKFKILDGRITIECFGEKGEFQLIESSGI